MKARHASEIRWGILQAKADIAWHEVTETYDNRFAKAFRNPPILGPDLTYDAYCRYAERKGFIVGAGRLFKKGKK